jgi:hypothetical protein
MTTKRTIIAMVVTKGWSLHQMDVKNVFSSWRFTGRSVHGTTTKFVDQTYPNLVCRLKKALYGLK